MPKKIRKQTDEAPGYQARQVSADDAVVDFPEVTAEKVPPGERVRGTELSMEGEGTTIASDVMTRPVKSLPSDSDLATVAALMRDENVGIVPIVDGDQQLLGVITDRDIVVRVDAKGTAAKEVRAADVMTTTLVTVRPDDDVLDILERMGRERLHRVLVTDDQGRLVEIISLGDLARRTDLPELVQDTLDQISRHHA
jgi:CBS domain-containing protein